MQVPPKTPYTVPGRKCFGTTSGARRGCAAAPLPASPFEAYSVAISPGQTVKFGELSLTIVSMSPPPNEKLVLRVEALLAESLQRAAVFRHSTGAADRDSLALFEGEPGRLIWEATLEHPRDNILLVGENYDLVFQGVGTISRKRRAIPIARLWVVAPAGAGAPRGATMIAATAGEPVRRTCCREP